MSKIKDVVSEIDELYSNGMTEIEIASILNIPINLIKEYLEDMPEEYWNEFTIEDFH